MTRLALADSWLVEVRSGVAVARALDLHIARFTAGLPEVGCERDPRAFLERAITRIAEYAERFGRAFPRLECWEEDGDFTLDLTLRPAPALTQELSISVAEMPANITQAHLKGPNIVLHADLAREHRSEVLLTTSEGIAVEGTTTSLLWWENDVLMCVPHDVPRVQSVTEQLVRQIAGELGVETREAHRTPQQLLRGELWAVNALHGIRFVTDSTARNPDRLESFRARYAALARAV